MRAGSAARRRAQRTVRLGTSAGIAESSRLAERLRSLLARDGTVTLDASELRKVDTAALQVLAAFVADAHGRGIAVEWRGVSEAARRSIELLGMAGALSIAPTENA